MVFEFLRQLVLLLANFSGGNFTEKALSAHWALVHELLEGKHFSRWLFCLVLPLTSLRVARLRLPAEYAARRVADVHHAGQC